MEAIDEDRLEAQFEIRAVRLEASDSDEQWLDTLTEAITTACWPVTPAKPTGTAYWDDLSARKAEDRADRLRALRRAYNSGNWSSFGHMVAQMLQTYYVDVARNR